MKNRITTLFILSLSLVISGCSVSAKPPAQYAPDSEIVVLAHGLGRSDIAMWRLTQRLEDAGYYVCVLDYDTIGESVLSVFESTSAQIDLCVESAPIIHFVGHSLGGLVVRSYLQEHQALLDSNRLGEVVLMGTPNKGSELADHYDNSWLMEIGGEISQALMTGSNSLGNQLKELDIDMGIIAGTKSTSFTDDLFDGPNDGLVSVESTKLGSMTDFIEIDVGHSNMRYNSEVAEQTIHFLRHGHFNHKLTSVKP
jgi:triacylglycerol esterase/lipase EstA (alpha/beta hydrolase family)